MDEVPDEEAGEEDEHHAADANAGALAACEPHWGFGRDGVGWAEGVEDGSGIG